MRTQRLHCIFAASLSSVSAFLGGCYSSLPVANYQLQTQQVEKEQCDVAMQFANGDELLSEDDLKNGPVFPAQGQARIISDPVCVKARGQAVKIPAQVTLHLPADNKGMDLCDEGTVKPARSEGQTVDAQVTCRWNLQFRHKYPMSMVLYVANPAHELSQHLRVVRVYRNGSLAFRWIATEAVSNSAFNGKHVLFIPGESLKGDFMPHLSGIDIRIIGTESPIDDAVMKDDVKARKDLPEERIRALWKGAKSSVLNAAFKQVVTEYFEASKHAEWKDFLDAIDAKQVRAEFASVDDLSALKSMATSKGIDLSKVDLSNSDVAEDFFRWVKLRSSGVKIEQFLDQANQFMSHGLSTVDNVEQLLSQKLKDAENLRTNAQAQAQLYNDVFQSLQSTTTVFEQYANNPVALPGESVLNMSYSDRSQWYFLAPWHGIAFHVSPKKPLSPSFNATDLVPIIDGVGMRWQFGRTRYGDVRLGLGVAARLEDAMDSSKPANGGETNTTEDPNQVFSLIPQLNVGVANFKFGVGIVAASGGQFDTMSSRMRYFVGADLFKIISGTNLDL